MESLFIQLSDDVWISIFKKFDPYDFVLWSRVTYKMAWDGFLVLAKLVSQPDQASV